MTLIKQTKSNLAVKGWIGTFAAILSLFSYIAYYRFYYEGVKLDELYFIATGLSISIFTGLLFTMFRDKLVRTFLLFASVFYGILIFSYSIHWWYTGLPYAYIKTSLICGLITGLIYFLYDYLSSSNSNVEN
jgi:hypothetical protein